MQAVSVTVFPVPAVRTFTGMHPFPVAHIFEPVLPDINDIIRVYVSLVVVGTYAGAGRDGSIYPYTGNAYSGLTGKKVVADLSFIPSQEAFASITDRNPAFLPRVDYEVHQLSVLFAVYLQFRIACSTSDREYGKYTPFLESKTDKIFLELVKQSEIALIDAGNDIEAKR